MRRQVPDGDPIAVFDVRKTGSVPGPARQSGRLDKMPVCLKTARTAGQNIPRGRLLRAPQEQTRFQYPVREPASRAPLLFTMPRGAAGGGVRRGSSIVIPDGTKCRSGTHSGPQEFRHGSRVRACGAPRDDEWKLLFCSTRYPLSPLTLETGSLIRFLCPLPASGERGMATDPGPLPGRFFHSMGPGFMPLACPGMTR